MLAPLGHRHAAPYASGANLLKRAHVFDIDVTIIKVLPSQQRGRHARRATPAPTRPLLSAATPARHVRWKATPVNVPFMDNIHVDGDGAPP